MHEKQKRKKRKNVHHSPLQKKKMNLVPRNFFLGKRPGDEVAEKH